MLASFHLTAVKVYLLILFCRERIAAQLTFCPTSLGKYFEPWAGALVWWLREETRNQKVVISNPGTRYWMDIFHILFVVKIATMSRRQAR